MSLIEILTLSILILLAWGWLLGALATYHDARVNQPQVPIYLAIAFSLFCWPYLIVRVGLAG